MSDDSSVTGSFRDEARSDLYFLNARRVLAAEGIDPTVGIEVFAGGDGILCGMREALGHLAGLLGKDVELWALDEGARVARKEVVLTIRCPYSAVGIYETALLGTLSQSSGWATAARLCVEVAGAIPVIHFGARHVHPAVSDRLDYAAMVGGCSGCATGAGAFLAGVEASGTMPHALVILFGDTVAAAEAFDRHMPSNVLRVVLVDTFRDEAEEAVRVAEALGKNLWGVRLDTPGELGGVTPDMVREVRSKLDARGHDHVKVLVSGGLNAERIQAFVDAGAPVDGFGVGSAISGARPIDFTMDIKEVDGRPVAKRGRVPGIRPNPRLKQVRA